MSVTSFNEKLEEIERFFPSLSSAIKILKRELLLLWTIISKMPQNSYAEWSQGNEMDLYETINVNWSSIIKIELNSSTPIAIVKPLIVDCYINLTVIKPAIEELYAIHLATESNSYGSVDISLFARALEEVEEAQPKYNREAVTSVKNLKAFVDLCLHLEKLCVRKEDLVNEIWKHARAVADHTAIFLYSWLIEKKAGLQLIGYDLKLTHLMQMTDPTHPAASAFYLKIFNSLGLSANTLPGETESYSDEMSFVDHLLLCINNQITHYQECQAGFQVDILMAYETLVKASVSYSPLSDKMILCRSIIKYITIVLPFSISKDSEEKNMDKSFDQLVAEIATSGFIANLLGYHTKSLKVQLNKFSDCISMYRHCAYPPLRHIFSKIICQKVLVKLVITASSLSSTPCCCSLWKHGFPSHCFSNDDIHNRRSFMEEVGEYGFRQFGTKREIIGDQPNIGKYIDGVALVQGYGLRSNEAIISVEILRSFQHLSKVIGNWYISKDFLKNLEIQLLVLVEYTTILLVSCQLEPQKNQELKLTQLLQMTTIKNAKVHSIYVHGFKTLTQSVYSPWPNELAEASFIDHMLLYLKELIQCESRSLFASLKEQLENLSRYLTVLRNTVSVKDIAPSSQRPYKIPLRMESFHSLVIKFVMKMVTISITDSEDAKNENLALLRDLEEIVTYMKIEVRKSFISDYPSIGFEFSSILKNMEEIMTFRSDVIGPMKDQFIMVYDDLQKLRSFLDRIKGKPIENKEQLKDLQQRIAHVSRDAEFHIQSYVNKDGPTYYHAMKFSVVIEDIQLLLTEIEGHDTEDSCYGNTEEIDKHGSSDGSTTSISDIVAEEIYNQKSSDGSTPSITDIVVGFEDQSDKILQQLVGTSTQRNIVAIVGMPGLGKTTIAKKVYNHSSVANRFYHRAWCCVSKSYQKKELLLQIYNSFTKVKVTDDQLLADHDIAEMLSKCLNGRRYLIVLDDVWETKTWDDLKTALRDDNNGSRVIITTRDHGVAQTMTPATTHGYLLPLRSFNDRESYILLRQKLFTEDGFPLELSDSGWMIAQKCRGIPLAVVLCAGILSRMEKNKDSWVTFGESLSAQIGDLCRNLIELSYTRLPDHLKCCFLYVGALPEDMEISARKLAWLWIAEEFVRGVNPERLEDIAENYLMDLIERSLVIGSKSVSRPGVKSCHVHDIVRDFCLAKAQEEKFLHVIRDYKKYISPDTSQYYSEVTHLEYRLSIYCKRNDFIKAHPSGPNVHTLFFHGLVDIFPNYPYESSLISRYFKLIKVLDLRSINIGDTLAEVVLMLHLRYLAVKGRIASVPTTIENLLNLETFILRGVRDEAISVPNSIWRLLKLRHLHIDDRISINLDSEGTSNSAILADMDSFSTPTIAYGDDVEILLRRLPNLRKLKCIFLDFWDDLEKCNRFPLLEFLTQLVSLKVSWSYKSFRSSHRFPCRFSFPSNLTKLTLSEFGLPWSEISAIGKLTSLNSLKLLSGAFSGKRWDMVKGEFSALKYLKLESLDVKVWSATDEHIPNLERLVLSKCERLKEIPSEFAYINTLEIIELLWCNGSAANSARSIREKAEKEYGDYTITVHMYPNEENHGASS